MTRDCVRNRFREWSLIMGRGATIREGGCQVKFYPYEKKGGGGVEQVLTMLKEGGGGQNKFWGSFSTEA